MAKQPADGIPAMKDETGFPPDTHTRSVSIRTHAPCTLHTYTPPAVLVSGFLGGLTLTRRRRRGRRTGRIWRRCCMRWRASRAWSGSASCTPTPRTSPTTSSPPSRTSLRCVWGAVCCMRGRTHGLSLGVLITNGPEKAHSGVASDVMSCELSSGEDTQRLALSQCPLSLYPPSTTPHPLMGILVERGGPAAPLLAHVLGVLW